MADDVRLADIAAAVASGLGFGDPGPQPLGPAAARLAGQHGVLGALPEHGPLATRVREARTSTRAHLVRAVADARLVAAAAADARAPLVALKGFVLARTLYPRADQRPFADVDVLTSPERFGPLLRSLEEAGGVVRTRNWTAMSALRCSEVTVVMPAGTHIDVHWHVVNVARLRRVFALDTAALLAGSRPGPGPLATVDPVAHLGYVCWHMIVSGGTRLLWAADVELLCREAGGSSPTFPHDLLHWAQRARTVPAVGVALDFAGAAFPGGAAARLAAQLPDSSWRAANRRLKAAVLARPAGRLSGAFLPRASRTSTLRSLLAVRPPVSALWGRLAPSQEELDVMPHEGGGEAARASYVADVAAGRL